MLIYNAQFDTILLYNLFYLKCIIGSIYLSNMAYKYFLI